MDLAAELAHFSPDPALANWITDAVQNRINQTQQEDTRLREQITRTQPLDYNRRRKISGIDRRYNPALHWGYCLMAYFACARDGQVTTSFLMHSTPKRENVMNQRELFLQRHLVTPIAAAILALSGLCAYAADPLPKSGSASVHSAWSASAEVKDLGEKHLVSTGVYWGASFNDAGKGFLHKMVWSCPGATIINGGSYVLHGYCVITDADGDKIYGKSEGKGPAEGVDLVGVVTYDGGTGKYQGIQGSHTYKCSGMGADGQVFCRQEASYRLP